MKTTCLGNMLSQTDGNGNVTAYKYNYMNKVESITYPSVNGKSNTEEYIYREDGTLASKRDKNGVTTTYSYDIFKRVIQENAGGEIKSYTYGQ